MAAYTIANLKAYLASNRAPADVKSAYAAGNDTLTAQLGNDRTHSGKGPVDADPVTSAFFRGKIIDTGEFNNIGELQARQIDLLINGDNVDLADPDIRQKVLNLFPSNSFPATNAKILTAATRDGSPFEVEFSANVFVTIGDLGQARQLP
jgi:hypothetical protein